MTHPMARSQLPVGMSALVLGLVIGLAGSFADNLLGEAPVVMVLRIVLWTAGGILVLAGVASTITMGVSERSGRSERARGGLRPA